MGFISPQRTPISPDDMVSAIAKAYKDVTGSNASKTILGLLVGQVALETGGTGGNFGSVHNYNIGNIRGSYQGNTTSISGANEIIDGKEVIVESNFRAYPDLLTGAKDYIVQLRNRPHWWDGLMSGTIDGFIKGLTTYPAYFTANAATYERVLNERMANYQGLIDKYGKTGLGLILGSIVAAGGAFAGYKILRRRT
jgi:flagellum-specific peptidoglycan hydrolase FlgJ